MSLINDMLKDLDKSKKNKKEQPEKKSEANFTSQVEQLNTKDKPKQEKERLTTARETPSITPLEKKPEKEEATVEKPDEKTGIAKTRVQIDEPKEKAEILKPELNTGKTKEKAKTAEAKPKIDTPEAKVETSDRTPEKSNNTFSNMTQALESLDGYPQTQNKKPQEINKPSSEANSPAKVKKATATPQQSQPEQITEPSGNIFSALKKVETQKTSKVDNKLKDNQAPLFKEAPKSQSSSTIKQKNITTPFKPDEPAPTKKKKPFFYIICGMLVVLIMIAWFLPNKSPEVTEDIEANQVEQTPAIDQQNSTSIDEAQEPAESEPTEETGKPYDPNYFGFHVKNRHLLHQKTPKTETQEASQFTQLKTAPSKTDTNKSNLKNSLDLRLKKEKTKQFTKKEVKSPPEVQAKLKYAEALNEIRAGRTDVALPLLQDTLKIWPSFASAYETLAVIQLNQGLTNQAITTINKGLRFSRKNPTLLNIKAHILHREKKYKAAINILEQATPLPIKHLNYYAFLASLYQKDNQPLKAARLYSQLLQIKPNNGVWWMAMGISLYSADKHDAALRAFERALGAGGLNPSLRIYIKQRIDTIRLSG